MSSFCEQLFGSCITIKKWKKKRKIHENNAVEKKKECNQIRMPNESHRLERTIASRPNEYSVVGIDKNKISPNNSTRLKIQKERSTFGH